MKKIIEKICEELDIVVNRQKNENSYEYTFHKFVNDYDFNFYVIIKKDDIHIQAWYPLGHGDKSLIEEPIFTELAKKYGKSNAQIILRWHIQQGNIVIPGSKNPEHIKDNANIFDFELTDDEMNRIAKINKNTRYYIPNPQLTASYATMELNPEADV